MYGERRSGLGSASWLAGAVLWTRVVPASGEVIRVLPDGCLDLIWSAGALFVAGPDTRAHVRSSPPGASFVGLRFAPGTGPTVLGVPAYELRDRRVPLDGLWPARQVRAPADRVTGAVDRGAAVEAVAADRLRAVANRGRGGPDPPATMPQAIVRALRAGAGVVATARAVGLSERQLHRRCLVAFGYGPKTLARVLRLRQALALARAGTPFATVAVRAGYADQAHLARDVKALAGVPLGVLTAEGDDAVGAEILEDSASNSMSNPPRSTVG